MAVFLKKFQQFWAHEKSLTVLLFILIVHIFIVIPFGQNTWFQRILFLVFYILLLSAGLLFLTKSKSLRIILVLILALSVLFGSGILFESVTLELCNNLIVVVFSVLMCWIVLLRTFSEGPVTIHRIQGAVVTYLLIGFIFSVLYHSVYLIEGDAAFKGLGSFDRKELMYFSLTTLTTVGYGDITPAVAATRSLANLEPLIGQLYPAILIARLVVMEYESSRKR